MNAAGRIVWGISIASVGQFLALMLAGAGHGWNTPFWVSLTLWFAYPATFVSLRAGGGHSFDRVLLVLAPITDVGLVALTFAEGAEYFARVMRFPGNWWVVAGWALIWVGWQFVVVARSMKPFAV